MNAPDTIAPTQQIQKKRHGCFFYGCITSLAILLVVGLGVVLVARHFIGVFNSYIAEYTDTQPMAMTQETIPAAELKALHERVNAFNDALKAGSNAPPLVLTGREINGLLMDALASGTSEAQKLTNRFHVLLDSDRIKAQVSLPIGDMFKVPFIHTQGRYLNGAAAVKVLVTNQQVSVHFDSLEVKGKPLPEEFMAKVRQQNFAENVGNDPTNAAAISRYDSILVQDGKLVVTPAKAETGK